MKGNGAQDTEYGSHETYQGQLFYGKFFDFVVHDSFLLVFRFSGLFLTTPPEPFSRKSGRGSQGYCSLAVTSQESKMTTRIKSS